MWGLWFLGLLLVCCRVVVGWWCGGLFENCIVDVSIFWFLWF